MIFLCIQKFGSFRDHTFKLDTGGYAYFDTINIQGRIKKKRLERGGSMS